MTDIYVHLFTDDGGELHDDSLIVSGLGNVPWTGDCLVAEGTRDESNPTKKMIFEVLRRYIIDESHVHLLVRCKRGEYEEYDVLGGFNPANLPPRMPR